MTLPAVSTDELKLRYEGDLTTRFSEEYLDEKLADTIALVQQKFPIVEARLTSGALLERNYIRVICDAVLRIVRNPEGYSSESEAGYSYGLRPVVASGNLWLTQDDLDMLTGGTSTRGPGVIGIGLDRGWVR
jgi:hypothetical protein